jgi:hypothetical protein
MLRSLIFWARSFCDVKLATSFNYLYLNIIVGICNEFNDN